MSIGEKLFKIQQEMNVPKDLYNKYGNFYYRNAETILAEFKKAAKDLKLVLLLNDEIVEIAGKVYVKATASITDYETNEEVLATAYAREADKKTGMDDAQITGAASSYARKYALNGLFLLDDVKDPDSDEYKNQQGKDEQQTESSATQNDRNTKSPKVNQSHITSLRKTFEEKGIDESKVLVMYKVEKIEDLTINQFKNIFDHESELIQQCGV